MSEERIKERCKREDIAIKIVKGFLEKDCYTDTELEYSLKTLLDLYNKQKEEIEDLKRDYEIITDDMKNHNVVYTDMPEFEERYISKDKIKDNIKELEILKMTSFANNEISKQVYKEQIDLINMQINVLKNLLEE